MTVSKSMKELAQRGLECDHKIESMLNDIWREFETIEPTLAKKLAESFGSAEFAALMIIGRFKDQPSVLEELSTKPLSKDGLKNLLELSPKFVAQLKEGVAESVRGETTDYAFDDQIPLFTQAEQARKYYEQALVNIFRQLKEADSEMANAALELWEDENDAALYFATPTRGLGGKSPLEMLEKGDRKAVLDVIFRLEYGIFS